VFSDDSQAGSYPFSTSLRVLPLNRKPQRHCPFPLLYNCSGYRSLCLFPKLSLPGGRVLLVLPKRVVVATFFRFFCVLPLKLRPPSFFPRQSDVPFFFFPTRSFALPYFKNFLTRPSTLLCQVGPLEFGRRREYFSPPSNRSALVALPSPPIRHKTRFPLLINAFSFFPACDLLSDGLRNNF